LAIAVLKRDARLVEIEHVSMNDHQLVAFWAIDRPVSKKNPEYGTPRHLFPF